MILKKIYINESNNQEFTITKEEAKNQGYDVDEPFFHGSHEKIKEIHPNWHSSFHKYDGIFVTPYKDTALSHGKKLTAFVAKPGKVLNNIEHHCDYDDYCNVIEHIKTRYPHATDDDVENVLYPCIVNEADPFKIGVDKVLHASGCSDFADASWGFQNDRGIIAKKLGYDIVSTEDEHGNSYFVPYGTDVKAIKDQGDNNYEDYWDY